MPTLAIDSWRNEAGKSLRNQLRWRLLLVFLGVSVFGSLVLLLGYSAVIRDSQRTSADDMAAHVLRAYQLGHEAQQQNADEVAAQISFMRIFAGDSGTRPEDRWVRLRAFFGAMEGKTGRFPAGAVLLGDGQVVFNFGADGPALAKVLQSPGVKPAWYVSAERQTLYGLFSVALWLGPQGRGTLVLARPIDNGWMRTLAPVDSELALAVDGRTLASSEGSDGIARTVDAAFSGRLSRDGKVYEQRPLPVFGPEPHLPRLVLKQGFVNPVSTATVLASSAALMGLLAVVLWLVIGRWSQRLTRRVAELSRASALFAQERRIGDDLQQALSQAAEQPDEVSEVALACRELMQSMIDHDQAHVAYAQNLDRLNQELEGRVQRRTAELSRTVDQLSQMQEELVQSEKLASLGAMVAGISHELNTPIGNAVTVSSTLLAKVEDFKGQYESGALKRSTMAEFLESLAQAADLISRSVQRAAALVASFKQVAIDRESERKRTFNLQELVHDMVTSLRPGMRHKAVVIVEEVPAGLACDSFPGPIGQVLTNLIQNAVLHGFAQRAGGNIHIRSEVQGPQVVMTVTDDGEGMSEHVLKHAFDPFFTTRMGQGGSGLGLSVSHRIATVMLEGSLTAESTPGKGSCFRFSFLREAHEAPEEAAL